MKRATALILVVLAGCSTAPIADVLDLVKPGRVGPGPYRGGVGAQHSTPEPGLVPAPADAIVPAPPPAPPVPPPAGAVPLP